MRTRLPVKEYLVESVSHVEPAGKRGGAHLIHNQVRLFLSFFALFFAPLGNPHLNGVQVVAGSNPAAPTLNILPLLRLILREAPSHDFHSNHPVRLVFTPHYYFHTSSLVIAFFSFVEWYLRRYTTMSTSEKIEVRRCFQ